MLTAGTSRPGPQCEEQAMNECDGLLPADAIGVPDAARLLGRRPGFLYRRLLRGQLRGWRIGGSSWVVSRADVLAMIEVVGPVESGHERAVRELAARGMVGSEGQSIRR